jgi:SAM-dependent methyltransferase
MIKLPESITSLSRKHGFTRSAEYDQGWMFDNSMGPNPLWLVEWLTWDMAINKDMLVLDMGCGKALTSIFLSSEYGCTVFANDLWIPANDNLKRITESGLEKRIFPIHAEAHALPYAKGQFDAIICVDSYQYYGTDDMYLYPFLEFLKAGGQIGFVVPGWTRELKGKRPFNPEKYPAHEFTCFHTAEWWKEHLSRSGLVEIEKCDCLENGHAIWLDSAEAMYQTKRILRSKDGTSLDETKKELEFWSADIDFLKGDIEKFAALIRIIGCKQ